jgi:hypothetical protein
MPRFSVRWLEIAIEYYDELPAATRQQIDARVEQILEWPEGPPEAYDARRDRWTTTYGDRAGLILYAVVREQRRVLILRLM